MTINTTDIEVKIKLLKSDTTFAQVTLILFGVWVEKGWRVSKSKNENLIYRDYVWVQPPCFMAGGKWQEIIFIDDRRLYEEVHLKILDAYYREKNKENAVGDETEIDPMEVDKANV